MAVTDVSGTISSDTTWTAANSPYHVTGTVTVESGAKLTIEADTIVKFDPNINLSVSGILDANGTASAPIYFTSYKDDDAGGDTNGDGNASNPAVNDWGGIATANGATVNIRYTTVRYSGRYHFIRGNTHSYGSFIAQNNADSHIVLDHFELMNAGGYGLYLSETNDFNLSNSLIDNQQLLIDSGQVRITGTTFRNRTYNGAIYVNAGADANITGNIFENNEVAVESNGAVLTLGFTGNTFTDNTKPIYLHNNAIASKIGTNTFDVPKMYIGGTLDTNTTLTQRDLVYVNEGLNVNTGKKLTIGSGVVLKAGGSITVYGTLDINGTATEPVSFTSMKDDMIFGDTNGDGNATTPAHSDWGGFAIANGANVNIKYAIVHYSGHHHFIRGNTHSYGSFIAQNNTNSHISLKHFELSHANNYGIYLSETNDFNLTDSYIDNQQLLIDSGQVLITGTTFLNRTYNGAVYINSTADANITGNTFLDNEIAIESNGAPLSAVTGNTFTGNIKPIYLHNNAIASKIGTNTFDVAKIYMGGTLDTNATLTRNDLVYVLEGITINAGKMMTVGAGVVTKFSEHARLQVNGELNVNATAGSKSWFTAYTDDDIAGDTNEDNTTTSPAPGYWAGISIGDEGNAEIHHAIIRYSGYRYDHAIYKTGDTGHLIVTDTNISKTGNNGIRIENAHGTNIVTRVTIGQTGRNCFEAHDAIFDLHDSNFTECGGDGAIYATGDTDGNITGNTFDESQYGIYFNNVIWNGIIDNNYFGGNIQPFLLRDNGIATEVGNNNVYTSHANVHLSGNTDLNTSLCSANVVYIIDGGMTVNAGKKLTICPDTVLKFNSKASLRINGALEVNATAGHESYFTAYTDDMVGGDSNEDNTTTSPTTGYWANIYIADNASANIRHAVMRYAGYNRYGSDPHATIYKTGDNGTLHVSDSRLSDSSSRLIRLQNTHAANTFDKLTLSASSTCFEADNAVFDLNDSNLSGCSTSIYAVNGNDGNITNNTISDSTYGFYANNTLFDGNISANSFENNTIPVWLIGNAMGTDLGSNSYTPAAKVQISSPLDINATLRSTDIVYVVSGEVTINPGKKLTIAPDVIVKFNGTGMSVKGTLEVNATEGHEVYLTSYKDDSVGGDSNEDNTTTLPAHGNWTTIAISDGGSADIQHTVIRYGGYRPSWTYKYATLYKTGDNGVLNIRDTNISEGQNRGIRLINTHAANKIERVYIHDIDNICFEADNALFDLSDSNMTRCGGNGAIYATNGSDGNITGNTITESQYGIYINNYLFQGNIYTNNFQQMTEPIHLVGNAIGTVLGHNSYDKAAKIYINGTVDTNTTLGLSDIVYIVNGDFTVSTGKKMTIAPDVIVKFNGTGMSVKGMLEVNGTEGHEVYLTSYKDDSVGGDSNEDNTTTQPARGNWKTIAVGNGGSANIQHAVIRYGGYRPSYTYSYATLYKTGNEGTLSVSDTNISEGQRRGIRLTNTQSDNRIVRVNIAGIDESCVEADNALFELRDSSLTHCGGSGAVYTLNGSDGNITGNTIAESQYGIQINNSVFNGNINGNIFTNNTRPVWLRGNAIGTTLGSNVYTPVAKSYIDGSLDMNATLRSTDLVYVADSFTVNTGKKLTINSDVIIKFKHEKGINVKGVLEINATKGHEAYFTAYTDDSVGGDTNEDNTTTTPAVGYWGGIKITDNASANVQHAVIRYSGNRYPYGIYSSLYKEGDNGTLIVNDTNITDSSHVGIKLKNAKASNTFDSLFIARSGSCFDAENAALDLNGSTFSECGGNGALYVFNGSDCNVSNSVIADGTYGVYLADTTTKMLIKSSSIESNTYDGIYNNGASLALENVIVRNNTKSGIHLQNVSDANITDSTIEINDEHGIYLDNSTADIARNTIAYNSQDGIFATGSNTTPTLRNNVIKYNDEGIHTENGANPLIGGSLADANDIFGNTSYGVHNTDSSVLIMARYNYWGDPDGPNAGQGDRVSDYVNFSHYLGKPYSHMAIMILSTDALDFKTVRKDNSSEPQTIQVRNIGNIDLDIDTFVVEGAGADAYQVTDNTCGGSSIAPDTNCSITVVLQPRQYHEAAASITLNTNDENHAQETIDLTGVGATGVPFQDTMDGTVFPEEWKITNKDASYYMRDDNSEKAGTLRIYTSNTAIDGASNTLDNLFTVPLAVESQQHYYLESHISFEYLPSANYQQGGIILMDDDKMMPDMDHYMRIGVVYKDNGLYVVARYEENATLQASEISPKLSLSKDQQVTLRIEKQKDGYTLGYSLNGSYNFVKLMTLNPHMDAAHAGIFAMNGPTGASRIPVDFDDFSILAFKKSIALPAIINYLLW